MLDPEEWGNLDARVVLRSLGKNIDIHSETEIPHLLWQKQREYRV